MSFEYNENLELMSRIKLVREEIKKQYPLIDNMAAVMSATLSPTVDDKPTNSERFERYYFILRYLRPDNEEYMHVFNDLYDVYEDGIEEEPYLSCMKEIIKYFLGQRGSFPQLEEFY